MGLFQFFNANVAERNRPMVALQKNGSGLIHISVQFAAGRFVALDIIVDFDSVEHDRDFVSNNRSLGGLPFVAGLADEFIRRFEIINRSIATR